jgi:hypothetical protein
MAFRDVFVYVEQYGRGDDDAPREWCNPLPRLQLVRGPATDWTPAKIVAKRGSPVTTWWLRSRVVKYVPLAALEELEKAMASLDDFIELIKRNRTAPIGERANGAVELELAWAETFRAGRPRV